MQCVVILRGAPGSGKSTIAKSLRNFEKKVVWIKVDNFKDFFSEDASLALQYVNGSALATLDYLLNEGFSVVMDGVFQDITVVDDAIKIAQSKNSSSIVYQLECSLESLVQRDTTRAGVREGFRKPLGEETISLIAHRLSLSPYPNAHILDTESLTLDQCSEVVSGNFQDNPTNLI